MKEGESMKIKKAASIYSIFMGISMIGMWIVFYVTDGIPEIHTKPIELGMDIAALRDVALCQKACKELCEYVVGKLCASPTEWVTP